MIEQAEPMQNLDSAAVERKRCIDRIRLQLKSAIALSRQQNFQVLEYMLKMADVEAEMFLEEPLEATHETSKIQIH